MFTLILQIGFVILLNMFIVILIGMLYELIFKRFFIHHKELIREWATLALFMLPWFYVFYILWPHLKALDKIIYQFWDDLGL